MPDEEKKKNLTPEILEKKFYEFMEKEGYDMSNINPEFEVNDDEPEQQDDEEEEIPVPKRIRKVSEKLNDIPWNFTIFQNTTKLFPGTVVYVIDSVAPNKKIPYVTYKPTERVITSIHSNGVDQGTLFFTQTHRIEKTTDYNAPFKVVADEEIIYSPLTKTHAEYICKLLNLQSKHMYSKYIAQMKKQQKTK